MPFHAPALRSSAAILALAALGLPATTLAQTSSSPPAELDALAAVELMNEVPEGIRASCMPTSATVPGALAAAQCLHEGGLVLYIRVADLSALETAYDSVAAMAGVSPDSGTSCAEGAFEGEHTTADGEVAGRIICQTGPDGPIAAWSDVDQLVLGLVQLPGADDWPALEAAWQAVQLEGTAALGQPPSSEAPSAVASATATREPDVSAAAGAGPPSSPGAAFHQWASGATASSQYGSDTYSASQATGPTDTTEYGDYTTAWAPAQRDAGPAWLELTFDESVIPSEVVVFESSGNGFVTSVELWDAATESWVTAWQGQDESPEFVIGFSPDLTSNDFATDRVRVNIDTDVEGWNEIDAVALIGTSASTTAVASAAP